MSENPNRLEAAIHQPFEAPSEPPSYRATFRRHRRLLIAPVVVAVIVAAWSVLGSAKSYQSTASLWVDTPVSADSSLGNANPALLPPAQQEQSVLTELLSSDGFLLAVADRGQLAHYLASHSGGGWGPTALLSGLGGGGSLKSRILAALGGGQLTSSVPGPQVLAISYVGPTPAVTASTLAALIAELQKESARFSASHQQGALAFYRAQVQSAGQALTAARLQVSNYLAAHPTAASNDPTLSALTTAQTIASSNLTRATTDLNQAASSGIGGGGTSGSVVQEIDPPTLPTAPVTGHKKQLLAVVGGLFAGLLVSFLGVVALTPGRRRAWEDEHPDPDLLAGSLAGTADAPRRTLPPGQERAPHPAVQQAADIGSAANGNGGAAASENGGAAADRNGGTAANANSGSVPHRSGGSAANRNGAAAAPGPPTRRRPRQEMFVELVRAHPGITVIEMATRMDVQPRSLRRMRARALAQGQVRTDGAGLFPAAGSGRPAPERGQA